MTDRNFVIHIYSHCVVLQATVSSLDTSAVKQRCRLPLNLAREEDVRSSSPTTTTSDLSPPMSPRAFGAAATTLEIGSQREPQRRLEKMEVLSLARYHSFERTINWCHS